MGLLKEVIKEGKKEFDLRVWIYPDSRDLKKKLSLNLIIILNMNFSSIEQPVRMTILGFRSDFTAFYTFR